MCWKAQGYLWRYLIKTQLTLSPCTGGSSSPRDTTWDNMQWVGTGQVHPPKPSPAAWNVGEKVRNCADAQKQQMGLEGVIKKKVSKE